MSDDLFRWIAARQAETDAARATGIPQVPKLSVASNVTVPLLQGAVVGSVLGISTLGVGIALGATWASTWRWALGVGFATFGIAELGLIADHAWAYTAGLRLAWEKFNATLPKEDPPPKRDPWRVIKPYNEKRQALLPDAVLDHNATALDDGEPEADEEIRLLYDFVTVVWPTGKVGREHCRQLGYTRSTWEWLIGGQRGRTGEGARGLLDRAGVVRKTSAGDWEIVAPTGAALGWNRELREYAKALKAYSRDKRDRTGRDTPVTADPVPAGQSRGGHADGS
jgi:hypothetical protein